MCVPVFVVGFVVCLFNVLIVLLITKSMRSIDCDRQYTRFCQCTQTHSLMPIADVYRFKCREMQLLVFSYSSPLFVFMVIYSGHQIHLLWLPWLIFAYFRAFVNIDMYNINIIIIIRYRSVFFSSIVAPNGWFAFRCNENKTGAEQNWNKTNPFPYNRFRNNAQLMRTHFSLVFHLFRGKTIYRFLFLSLSLSPSLSRSLVVQSDTYERTHIYHFQKKENRPQWKCANWTNKHEPKKKSASLIANVTLR